MSSIAVRQADRFGRRLALVLLLVVTLAGLARCDSDILDGTIELNPNPSRRQYLISPRIGRSGPLLWNSPDSSQPLWGPEVAPGFQLAHLVPHPAVPRSLVFLVGNRRFIGQRSGGLLPQARIGRASPMGLMPQPRIGRRSDDQVESREVSIPAISDSSVPDSIEAILSSQ